MFDYIIFIQEIDISCFPFVLSTIFLKFFVVTSPEQLKVFTPFRFRLHVLMLIEFEDFRCFWERLYRMFTRYPSASILFPRKMLTTRVTGAAAIASVNKMKKKKK